LLPGILAITERFFTFGPSLQAFLQFVFQPCMGITKLFRFSQSDVLVEYYGTDVWLFRSPLQALQFFFLLDVSHEGSFEKRRISLPFAEDLFFLRDLPTMRPSVNSAATRDEMALPEESFR